MTDLTGAKLALATARVVGKRNPKLWEQTWGEMTCVRTDECSGLLYEWRPDRGGAAAWEVWVWLVAQCHGDAEIAGALVVDQQLIADDYAPENVPTYTCRAVVALGEVG